MGKRENLFDAIVADVKLIFDLLQIPLLPQASAKRPTTRRSVIPLQCSEETHHFVYLKQYVVRSHYLFFTINSSKNHRIVHSKYFICYKKCAYHDT